MKSIQSISLFLLFLPLLVAGAAFKDRLPMHEELLSETSASIESQPTSAPQATAIPQDNSLKRIYNSFTSAIRLFLSRTADIKVHQHHEHKGNKSLNLHPRSPEEYKPKNWPNAGFGYDPNDISTQYPWRPQHDVYRIDHQNWKYGSPKAAYCIHVKPNLRKPITPAPAIPSDAYPYLPRNCTSFIHTAWGGANRWTGKAKLIDCGDPDMLGKWDQPMGNDGHYPVVSRPNGGHQSLTAYIENNANWENPEHCRAGCETCFDAMAEFGAEQAVCRRRVGGHFGVRPQCGAGIVLGSPPSTCYERWKKEVREWTAGKEHLFESPWQIFDVRPWWTGKACAITWDSPLYQELGYFSMEDAMADARAGAIRTYYVEDVPNTGYDVAGDLGEEALLKILLGSSRDGRVTEQDIKETINRMSPAETDRYKGS